jgi:hypothetical protein
MVVPRMGLKEISAHLFSEMESKKSCIHHVDSQAYWASNKRILDVDSLQCIHKLILPDPMHASAHRVVHDVITLCYLAEDLTY